jgi:hypothetical protein
VWDKARLSLELAESKLRTLHSQLKLQDKEELTLKRLKAEGGDKVLYISYLSQFFGSGFGLDPDSIRSVDPYLDPESGSGSRRAKMTHKSRK